MFLRHKFQASSQTFFTEHGLIFFMLTIEESLNLMRKNGFSVAKFKTVSTAREAVAAAKSIGYPVVMKIVSEAYSHKTEAGGVLTHLDDLDDIKTGFRKLSKISKKVIVQKQVKGIETIIGVKDDPTFGSVILFGMGGVFVEAMRDVAFRICPISKRDAGDMIKETKGSKILLGFRGKEYDLESLKSLLIKVSDLSQEKKIRELDLNPVIINEKNAWIVDARIDLAE